LESELRLAREPPFRCDRDLRQLPLQRNMTSQYNNKVAQNFSLCYRFTEFTDWSLSLSCGFWNVGAGVSEDSKTSYRWRSCPQIRFSRRVLEQTVTRL